MRTFDKEFLQHVKDSNPIIDVIQAYGISVKQKGNKYWACCPFHHEKTPSFAISPDEGFYYCFGCHASGDVITFVEKMDNLSFFDAVAHLAEMAHIEMPQEEMSLKEKQEVALKQKLYEVTILAGEYFHNCLLKTNMGKPGLAYFGKRHLTQEIIKQFKLGFAPADWNRLYKDFTQKKHISEEILVKAGLIGKKNGRCYDTFRNRCMFPIMDLRGKVVAFGGRILNAEESHAKYLNSPETSIFNKRKLLFPIYQALPEIKKRRQAIMVEGYMDAISLHANGIKNAVASLGTAFTVEQARLLKKYADEVVFSYDMDSAGQNATKRALEIAGSVGLKLRVALIGEGKDPDEFVNLHGGDAYLEVVKQAKPALDYLFESLCKQYDGVSLEGQQKILNEMFTVLLAQDNTYLFNSFIRKMARSLHMDEGMIRSEAFRYTKKNNGQIYISQHIRREDKTKLTNTNDEKQMKLEEGLLRYCLSTRTLPKEFNQLETYSFIEPFHERLYKVLQKTENIGISTENAEAYLDREDIEKMAKLLVTEREDKGVPLEEFIRPLKKIYLQNEYKIHTKRAAELMDINQEEAKKEQLRCIELSREIRLLEV